MSSRQDEKQKRRAEREAAEAAAAKSQSRKERLQLGMGALVAVAAVIVAVVVFAGGGGDGGKDADQTVAKSTPGVAPLPAVKTTDLAQAAKLASCTLSNPANEGRNHTSSPVTYKTNPPSSGNHNPTPAEDGIYEPGNTPEKENYVHSLEHGRIEIEYKPGTDAKTIDRLEQLASEPLSFGRDGYKTLTFQNNTGMAEQVAAVAWTHILACPKMDEGVFDAVRAFRKAYTDKGPELIP